MFGRKPKKHGLYYLLPGMSRANRDKRRKIFWVSLTIGILAALAFGTLVWVANRAPHL